MGDVRCDSCGREIVPPEPLYYECPDGLPGHDWLNCGACHVEQFGAGSPSSAVAVSEEATNG